MIRCTFCKVDTKNPKYCSLSCQYKDQGKGWLEKQWGKLTDYSTECYKCKKSFIVSEYETLHPKKEKYFCSRSCANSRNQQGDSNTKRKETFRLKRINLPYNIENVTTRKCPMCSVEISYKTISRCRRATKINTHCQSCVVKKSKLSGHFSNMGKRSVTKQSVERRSKNEIYFANLCKEKFKTVLTNEPLFNGWDADVILPELKIAILWNGIWHYQKIRKQHSVEQVQNRDKMKLDEIVKAGYSFYIIKDMGKFNPDFVNEEFNKFCSELKVSDT